MQPKIFGSLESDIMRVLWERREASVRDVHDTLSRSRRIAYTTVMTVMQRLAEKKVLRRRPAGNAYVYRAASDRSRYLRDMLGDFFSSLKREFGEAAVSSFLDELGKKRK